MNTGWKKIPLLTKKKKNHKIEKPQCQLQAHLPEYDGKS